MPWTYGVYTVVGRDGGGHDCSFHHGDGRDARSLALATISFTVALMVMAPKGLRVGAGIWTGEVRVRRIRSG